MFAVACSRVAGRRLCRRVRNRGIAARSVSGWLVSGGVGGRVVGIVRASRVGSVGGLNTVDIGRYYAILASSHAEIRSRYLERGAKAVPEGFSYNSGDNAEFLTVEQLRDLIALHVTQGSPH